MKGRESKYRMITSCVANDVTLVTFQSSNEIINTSHKCIFNSNVCKLNSYIYFLTDKSRDQTRAVPKYQYSWLWRPLIQTTVYPNICKNYQLIKATTSSSPPDVAVYYLLDWVGWPPGLSHHCVAPRKQAAVCCGAGEKGEERCHIIAPPLSQSRPDVWRVDDWTTELNCTIMCRHAVTWGAAWQVTNLFT